VTASIPVEVSAGEPGEPDIPADAGLLSAVADPTRLTILHALTRGTLCVCDLQTLVPIAANLLSYHLKVLRDAGLIVSARRSRWVDYTLTSDAVSRMHAALPGHAAGS
jgi:ArsR family transcriptional regulator, arsenate/arsenite/antimonite-responsive transcriptional repressor